MPVLAGSCGFISIPGEGMPGILEFSEVWAVSSPSGRKILDIRMCRVSGFGFTVMLQGSENI